MAPAKFGASFSGPFLATFFSCLLQLHFMSLLHTIEENRPTILYILGWYVFSLLISVYNKWMFGAGLDFRFPVLITAFHQLVLVSLSAVLLWTRRELRPTVNQVRGGTSGFYAFVKGFKIAPMVYIRTILPCALASSGDIGLSNVSIRFVSLLLYTMLKTSSLVFVLIFGILFKLEKFNWRLIVIVGVMTGSVLMMVKKPDTADTKDSDALGIALVLGASVVSGLRWSFTQLLLKHNPYTPNPISTIFYIAPAMFATLAVVGVVFEGWSNFTLSNIWTEKGVIGTIVLMIIPGILAFMMTLCEFKLLSVAQVITLSIAGIFKELLTIVISAIVFGDRLSLLNMFGLLLTFADILWYNYFRYSENTDNGYETVIDEELHEIQDRDL